jgi:hypothetical protein
MKALSLIGLALVLTGCGALLPSTNQRSQSAQESSRSVASQSQSLSKVVEGQKAPEIRVGGWGNKVEFRRDRDYSGTLPEEMPVLSYDLPYRERTEFKSEVDTNNDATSAAHWWSKSTIPMGVNLMLLAGGILAIIFAINRARNASASANALFGAADSGLASLIRSLRDRAALTTDPARVAEFQTQIAELEAQRGRLSR